MGLLVNLDVPIIRGMAGRSKNGALYILHFSKKGSKLRYHWAPFTFHGAGEDVL